MEYSWWEAGEKTHSEGSLAMSSVEEVERREKARSTVGAIIDAKAATILTLHTRVQLC
jgi:hypothetical protein